MLDRDAIGHGSQSSAASQRAFAARLREPGSAAPAGLRTWNGASAERRFSVYRNNVAVGLVDALAARFPVCRRLVGGAFFAAAAGVHALDSPPRSPVMAEYGAAFADFIADFPPAAPVPYLADMARLEYAVGRAYHAADAEPLAADAFGAFPPDRLGDLVVGLHPSAHLFASAYAVVSLWLTNTHDAEVQVVDAGQAEDALVLRPHLDVAVTRLPPGGHAFLTALAEGATLAAAAERGACASPTFDLADNLVVLFTSGIAVAAGIAA